MNSRKNGIPMIRMAKPADIESPVIAKVKYTMPVTSDSVQVQQREVGARVEVDAEEAPERGAARRRLRRAQCRAHLDLVRAVGVGDFLGRAVAGHDAREHIGFAVAGRRLRELGAQMLLGVVERILYEGRVCTAQGFAQRIEVLLDVA